MTNVRLITAAKIVTKSLYLLEIKEFGVIY